MGSRTLTGYTVRKREGAVYGGSRTRAESLNFSHHSCHKGYCSLHMVVWSPSLSRSGYSPAPSWLPLWAQPPLPSPVALLLLEWIWMEPQQAASESGFFHFTNAFGMFSVSCPFCLPSDSSLLGCTAMCLSIPSWETFELFGLLMITSSCYKYLSANFCENIRFHFS